MNLVNIIQQRYRVIRLLGEGGFGKTYEVESLNDSEINDKPHFALKQLHSKYRSSTDWIDRFQKEAAALYLLGSKYDFIPTLHDYFEDGKNFYIVQELIIGNTLAEELGDGKIWSQRKVLDFLIEMTRILKAVHQEKIIHRDIKPANIIRRKNGKLVLIDFGIIKEITTDCLSLANTSIGVGTNNFTPPEQWRGKPHYNSDIYALGIIAILGLTAKYPIDLEEYDWEIDWRYKAGDRFANVIAQMVCSRSSDRYSDANTLLEVLENLRKSSHLQPQIIDSLDKLQDLVTNLNKYTDPYHPVAWNIETTSQEPRDVRLVGIGCCWGEETNSIAYIPLGHDSGNNLELELVCSNLKPILESIIHPKVLQNAKFTRLVLKNQDINLQGVVFDTMLASYVLNPDNSRNLTDLSSRYLGGIIPLSYTKLVNSNIPLFDRYYGMDIWIIYRLHDLLRAELAADPMLLAVLEGCEQLLEPILANMEDIGINIDAKYLKNHSLVLAKDLERIESEIYTLAGEKFNLGSPKQIAQILFEKLQLDTQGVRQTKSGYTGDVDTLKKLHGKHEVVDLILQHRTFSRLKSIHVDALPALIHPKTGRFHTDFNQAVTSTGRLLSFNRTLQNIRSRTEFSRQIRPAFIPAPGWILAAADYSQIEFRILAHLSQEPALIKAYKQNKDIHTITAQLLFESNTVTSKQRRMGKIINFGVVNGMGAAEFGRETGIETSEAKIFFEKFHDRYPGIFDYLDCVKREALALGYVKTICGRRRYFQFESGKLRGLKGSDPNSIDLDNLGNLGQVDAGHLRAAANAPIQGLSADIIKLAMIKIDKLLEPYQAKMLLQVHDELVLEVPQNEWEELKPKIKVTMEGVISLSVPMVVEIGSGVNWMEAN